MDVLPDMTTKGWIATNGRLRLCQRLRMRLMVTTDKGSGRVTRVFMPARPVPIKQCRAATAGWPNS